MKFLSPCYIDERGKKYELFDPDVNSKRGRLIHSIDYGNLQIERTKRKKERKKKKRVSDPERTGINYNDAMGINKGTLRGDWHSENKGIGT